MVVRYVGFRVKNRVLVEDGYLESLGIGDIYRRG